MGSIRVAKVPGAKWRLVEWYVAHLPARRVYIEPCFGSGAVLFNKPRSRSGWRHDGPSGRRGRSVAMEWADLPGRIESASRRLQGVHIESRPALDVLARYNGPEVVAFIDPPYPRLTVHGQRARLYRHEMLDPAQHRDLLSVLLEREGPTLTCSYRNDIYDGLLLNAGWSVVEAQALAEHGNERVEALYLNRAAAPELSPQLELLGGA